MFRGIENWRNGDYDIRRVNVEIPTGSDMQVSDVNKVHRTRNSEKEAESPQSLEISEYLAFG